MEKTYEIASCDDFELNIKRKNPLTYTVSYPAKGEIKTILFIIAGFGEDTNSDYLDHIRNYVAETFQIAVVNVFYHCFSARRESGARLDFDDIDIAVLEEITKQYRIDFSSLETINIDTIVNYLDVVFTQRKAQGQMATDEMLMIPMTFIPQNGDYQNFGIIQAIDHINVLQHLKKELPNIASTVTTIFLGSSHGGYIAHLAAKLAPSLVHYVIDNSCYVKPPLPYIVGKETDVNHPETLILYGDHLKLHCFVQTLWTTNTQSPYYFSADRYRIRDLTDQEHLNILSQTQFPKTSYISYHSLYDGLAPAQDKIDFYNKLKAQGYDATLHLIHSAEQVDGRLIKSLDHAMDMSIKELINIELPKILKNRSSQSTDEKSEIVYHCDSFDYSFKIENGHYTCLCKTRK